MSIMAASSSYSPVHLLWSPPEGTYRTELDVVFFHGVQFTGNDTCDAWNSTWTQRGRDDVCWAREWLPLDLGKAVRILSVSYNAHVATSPHRDVSEIAENLVQSLINSGYEWDHPIVLIGHSFGGLVLKSLVVNLKWRLAIDSAINSWSKVTLQRAEMFLTNVRGVVFYAVPHSGSNNFAEYAEYVNKLLRCNSRYHPGIMDNMRPWLRNMETLSVDFESIVNGNEINVFAFCEGIPMEKVGILVEFSSAQRLARHNSYKVEDADHMEVCKPPSKKHPSYSLLLQFITTCGKTVRERDIKEIHDLPNSTFGLEKYVEKLVTLLISEDSVADPQYVGICGMGGVGKTLLLDTLCANEKVRGHFQGAKFIWRTVGQTPNIMALYRSLSEALNLDPEMNLDAEDYKRKLQSQFILKRVFLVLDDIWQDDTFDLLDLAKGKGSVTLLSTRNKFILERASPQISGEYMTTLSMEDSWNLFRVHAFRSSHVPYELEELAQSVAEECEGLPLALKVIGRAMFRKTSPEREWKPALKKLRESRMVERPVKEKLYERLEVGYDELTKVDERLKDCFLHFAAFPEDSNIIFESILWHWIGEGVVPADDRDDPEADAFFLLSKLWERSFIEKHGEDGWDNLYFTVHDVMRDLAFYILGKDGGAPPAKQLYLYQPGQNLEKFPGHWQGISKALKLSLMENNLKILPSSFCAPQLVSLQLSGNPIENVPASFFINFQNLRVLNLSYGRFCSLPEQLGDLTNLIYLNLFYCICLSTLPETVGKLHMLKYLDIRVCWMLDLPHQIYSLTSLQVLHTMGSDLAWPEHTSSDMRVESLDHECLTTRASSKGIWGLINLTELSLSGALNPEVKAPWLLPHDMSALTSLRRLRLELVLETLPVELPYWFKQLEELELWDRVDLTSPNIPSSFTRRGAFPSLIRFQLSMCRTLDNFPGVHEGALPQLRTLELTGCESLRTLPLSLEHLTSLRKLILSNCNPALKDSCTRNCEKSSIWRKFDLRYDILMLDTTGYFSNLSYLTKYLPKRVLSSEKHHWLQYG